MSSIKCTAKLAKRAGFKLEAPIAQSVDDWHANLFTFDRRFYVIFVHDTTRLSCIAGPVKKADLQNLKDTLSRSLQAVMIYEGFNEREISFALNKINEMEINKTDSRSVLGTINDNLFLITHHAATGGGIESVGLTNLSAKVNHMPLSPLNWRYAIEDYKRFVLNIDL
jgi:hypothetical protein